MTAAWTVRWTRLAGVLVLLGGCAGMGIGRRTSLTASPHPFDSDIPLPEGFRLADQTVEPSFPGPVRSLHYRYRGRADNSAVRDFYRKQMPLVRWTMISESSKKEGCVMRFTRGQDACIITIANKPHRIWPTVVVDVRVSRSRQPVR